VRSQQRDVSTETARRTATTVTESATGTTTATVTATMTTTATTTATTDRIRSSSAGTNSRHSPQETDTSGTTTAATLPSTSNRRTRLSNLRRDVEFTLRNESDEEVGINPHDWNVYKLHDGAWKLVKPREIPEPWRMIPPGETESQTLSVSTDADEGDVALGDGVYGFYLGTRDYAAAFEVVGTELVVEPTDAVTRTERDGNVMTVYTRAYEEMEDYQTPGMLVVRRGDSADTPTPQDMPEIVREQAANEAVLRNTLPYFETEDGVDEVRLRIPTTHRGNLGMLLSGGVSGTTRYFVYEGEEHSVELVEDGEAEEEAEEDA